MSTPIENNTEGLLEILQTVNNLPEAGSGVRNQDITITENGTYTFEEGYTGLGTVTVEVAQEFPNAEDAYFGTKEEMDEFSILSYSKLSSSTDAQTLHIGNNVRINEAVSLKGFRMPGRDNATNYVKLWDAETLELVASATITTKYSSSDNVWYESRLNVPINLVAGKTYTISLKTGSGDYEPMIQPGYSNVTFNSKVTHLEGLKQGPDGVCPTESFTNKYGFKRIVISLIMGEPLNATVIAEYKIQKTTLNEIADEVRRIIGTSETMTTEEMVTALQGVTAG